MGDRVLARGRLALFALGDAVLLALSLVVATALRFDGFIPAPEARQLPAVIALSLLTKLAIFYSQGLYSLSWSQVGLEEMVTVFRGVTLGSVAFWVLVFVFKHTQLLAGFPRSVLLIDYIITLHAVGAFRIGRRVYQYVTRPHRAGGRPALIVGAGAAGRS